MNARTNTFRTLSVLALAATLAACGGGGGGGSDSSSGGSTGGGVNNPGGGTVTTPSTDVVTSAGTLKTSAGIPAYAGAGFEAEAFAAINATRLAAGAGLVSQSAALDTAAAAHAKYLTSNIALGLGHAEDPTKADYYEATEDSRATKAGYPSGFVTEAVGGTGATMKASDCVLGLLNTVYHAAAVLSPATNVGVGVGTDAAGIPMCVTVLGAPASEAYPQVAAAGDVVAYPSAGQTGVVETFYVAYELPRPPVTLFPNTTAGRPVIVSVRNADFVNFKAAGTLAAVVTKFELKDAGGNVVPAGILANAGLTGSGVTLTADSNLGEGFAVLVPLAPLAKGAVYTATFTATLKSGGTPVAKTWSFTTNN